MPNIHFYISRANIYAGAQKFFDDFIYFTTSSCDNTLQCKNFNSLSRTINLALNSQYNNCFPTHTCLLNFLSSIIYSGKSDIHFSSSYAAGFLSAFLCLILGKKHVYVVHGVLSSRSVHSRFSYYFLVFFDWLLFVLARNLIFIAPCDINYYRRLPLVHYVCKSILSINSISPLESSFNYPFHSFTSFLGSRSFSLPNDVTFHLCMTARFESQKNQLLILHSILDIPYVSVCFFGDGVNLEAVRNFAISNGLSHRVFFFGHIQSPFQYYNLFDLFVLASNWESLPFSLIEALRAGLPFISSDVGSCDYLSNNRECGCILSENSPKCLSNVLVELYNSPNTLSSMSRSCLDFYANYLSTPGNYLRIIRFLQSL